VRMDIDPISRKTWLAALLTPQILAVLLHRIAHCLHTNRRTHLASAVALMNAVIHKMQITPRSCIGDGCLLPHPVGMCIDANWGCDVTVYALATCVPDVASPGRPHLGDRVIVGGRVAVIGAVQVGDDTKIAPMVRLTADAPARVLVISRSMRVAASSPIAPPPETDARSAPADSSDPSA